MKQFTFILEFRKGTYISQVYSKGIDQAKVLWLKELSNTEVTYLGKKSREELRNAIMDKNSFGLLQGMDNVYCNQGILKTGYYLLNVVVSK